MDDAAHPEAWRAWFMAVCASSVALLLVFIVLVLTVEGDPDVQTVPTGNAFAQRVTSAPPHSSVQVGDIIDFRLMPNSVRWTWYNSALSRGQSYTLTVIRNGRPVHVSILARPLLYFGASFTSAASWPYWLAVLGVVWTFAFASLIAWRRPASLEARVLALLLLLTPLGVMLYSWKIAPPVITALLYIAGQICAAAGPSFTVMYIMLFKPASRLRTFLACSVYALWALWALQACAYVFAVWTLTIDPNSALFNGIASRVVFGLLPLLVPILCGVFAIAETRGAARARLSWAMASLGLFYLLLIVAGLVGVLAPSHASVVSMLQNMSLFIAPLGLTYGLLNRKLLDIGFALNRAAIFTAVSAVVVGLFVLVEWAFGEWLKNASHAANVAVSGGLALLLGISVRFVHGRVEHVVDNVFFRKRHEDEAALRAFAYEAGYINNAETLVARTIAVLKRHADASSVQLAVDDGDGRYGDVNEDDPAIVALRAWNRPVDLHNLETELCGDVAFPLVARGRLIGALILGPKRSRETYAPDESDAIMRVAHNVGASLFVLDRSRAAASDAVVEIRALSMDMQQRLSAIADGTRNEIRALSQRLDLQDRMIADAGQILADIRGLTQRTSRDG